LGGVEKLKTVLNKPRLFLPLREKELSTVAGDVCSFNGDLKGQHNTVIEDNPNGISMEVHEKFGTQFPLLFKYLDAREDLSIQVHPNDVLLRSVIILLESRNCGT
jgi:mannose-6-phosphate isomerase